MSDDNENTGAASTLNAAAGSQQSVQDIANRFNREYIKACETGWPKDWYQAALTARQLVGEMGKAQIITDNFREVYNDEVISANTEVEHE